MTRFRICLLGKFAICRNGEPVQGLDAARKGQEFLTYLLLYRDRAHAREALAATLWPDCSPEQSRKYLRQSLWHLQSALGAGDCESLLRVELEWISVNPDVDLDLDIAALEHAFLAVQGVPGHALDTERIAMLEHAARLYTGDLLPGCAADWCVYERERLARFYQSLTDKLMAYFEARQEHETACFYGEEILRRDRCSERTHRRMMRLHYQAGDRSAALQQYRRCAAALEEELNARPGHQTEALYQQILVDQMEGAVGALPALGQLSESGVGPLSDTLGRLRDCLSTLTDLRHQLQHQLQAADLLTNSRR
jgi:DNA-binding SARP family transcriptional activator